MQACNCRNRLYIAFDAFALYVFVIVILTILIPLVGIPLVITGILEYYQYCLFFCFVAGRKAQVSIHLDPLQPPKSSLDGSLWMYLEWI